MLNGHVFKLSFREDCNNHVYIWRKSDEVDNPRLECATSKTKLSVMIWGCICSLNDESVETMTSANGNIDSVKHIEIFEKKKLRVINVRYFPHENYAFQDDNTPSINHDSSAPTWQKINYTMGINHLDQQISISLKFYG